MKKLIFYLTIFFFTINSYAQNPCTDTIEVIGIYVDSTNISIKSDTLTLIRQGETWKVQYNLNETAVLENVFTCYIYKLNDVILPEKWIIKTISTTK